MTFESLTKAKPSGDAPPHLQRPFLAVMIGASCVLAGCSVGPDYRGAGLTFPARYFEASATKAPGSSLSHWWTTFRDPVLDELVGEAVAGNLSVASSAARIREARATRRVAVGPLFPAINGSGSALDTRSAGNSANAWLVQAGLDASWELDLFGGERRKVEAASYGVEAAHADLRATLLTLIGDICTNYIEVRGTDARLALARQTSASERETVGLTKTLYSAGSSSSLDLANATALETSTEAAIPPLVEARAEAIHRLGILLGREPGALVARLAQPRPLPQAHDMMQPGFPADLLSRRPDIAKAERQLAQATADIGVADAALYPSVSLTGSLTSSAARVGDLGKGTTIGWSWGPSVSVPLFSGGQLVAQTEVAGAQRDEARLALQALVLTAMEDVENALVLRSQERLRIQLLTKSASAYRDADQLSKKLWQSGSVPFLNVLDAERSLYSAQDSLIQSRMSASDATVALAKALGGGWDGPVDVSVPIVIDQNTGPHFEVIE